MADGYPTSPLCRATWSGFIAGSRLSLIIRPTLGTALNGAHGSLVLNASGAFTYTVHGPLPLLPLGILTTRG